MLNLTVKGFTHNQHIFFVMNVYTYSDFGWFWFVCRITGPPNGPVLFCSLASLVVVCQCRLSSSVTLLAGRPTVGRLTLHGGPVGLRPIRATRHLVD